MTDDGSESAEPHTSPSMTSSREWYSASGIPLEAIYTSNDVPIRWQNSTIAVAGVAPFVRGAYPRMYRERPWRIFQLSGYGDPEDMNRRLKYLLAAGETGIIIKHDRMTDDHLYDVDHPEIVERKYDVGLTGTVTVGLRDYETILSGLPIEQLYVKPGGGVPQSAPYTLGCYWSVASRRGVPLRKLRGTGQSDFLLTYLGCPTKEQVPPDAAMRMSLDIVEFCLRHMPHWIPVSVAGYNGAESGLTAPYELAVVMANAIEYVDGMIERGDIDVTQLVKSLGGVNFRTSMDVFEDIAKLRVARKLWSDLVRSKYGIDDPEIARLRIHVVTSGSAMTYQEPLNNIVRGTIMGLAAVFGGVQSLGVCGFDEAISIPSDEAHLMSIRIQQILQEETNLLAVADPLGGSYYLESLCAALEERAWNALDEIRAQGGFLEVIRSGWLMGLAESQQVADWDAVESGKKQIVGVNVHRLNEAPYEVSGFTGREGASAWEAATERLRELRRTRDGRRAAQTLHELEAACRGSENIVPFMLAALQADASIGEIGGVFRVAFGNWQPPFDLAR